MSCHVVVDRSMIMFYHAVWHFIRCKHSANTPQHMVNNEWRLTDPHLVAKNVTAVSTAQHAFAISAMDGRMATCCGSDAYARWRSHGSLTCQGRRKVLKIGVVNFVLQRMCVTESFLNVERSWRSIPIILFNSLVNVNSRSRSLYAIARPSVVCHLSVVWNVRAPYSAF